MPELIVDLKTDYLPGTDFGHAEVIVASRESDERRYAQYALHTSSGGDYATGVRIAEFAQIDGDRVYTLMVKLLDARGRTVDFKVVLIDMPSRNFGVTALISRS